MKSLLGRFDNIEGNRDREWQGTQAQMGQIVGQMINTLQHQINMEKQQKFQKERDDDNDYDNYTSRTYMQRDENGYSLMGNFMGVDANHESAVTSIRLSEGDAIREGSSRKHLYIADDVDKYRQDKKYADDYELTADDYRNLSGSKIRLNSLMSGGIPDDKVDMNKIIFQGTAMIFDSAFGKEPISMEVKPETKDGKTKYIVEGKGVKKEYTPSEMHQMNLRYHEWEQNRKYIADREDKQAHEREMQSLRNRGGNGGGGNSRELNLGEYLTMNENGYTGFAFDDTSKESLLVDIAMNEDGTPSITNLGGMLVGRTKDGKIVTLNKKNTNFQTRTEDTQSLQERLGNPVFSGYIVEPMLSIASITDKNDVFVHKTKINGRDVEVILPKKFNGKAVTEREAKEIFNNADNKQHYGIYPVGQGWKILKPQVESARVEYSDNVLRSQFGGDGVTTPNLTDATVNLSRDDNTNLRKEADTSKTELKSLLEQNNKFAKKENAIGQSQTLMQHFDLLLHNGTFKFNDNLSFDANQIKIQPTISPRGIEQKGEWTVGYEKDGKFHNLSSFRLTKDQAEELKDAYVKYANANNKYMTHNHLYRKTSDADEKKKTFEQFKLGAMK